MLRQRRQRMQHDGINRTIFKHWPKDLVCIVNGELIYKADVLAAKRERQRRELTWRRRVLDPFATPCYIWTFHNDSFVYGGWHLYVRSHRHGDWGILPSNIYRGFIPRIMSLYPCGFLPLIENLEPWKAAFAAAYHRPTWKRPEKQGMTPAWATIDDMRRLIDINLEKPPDVRLLPGRG